MIRHLCDAVHGWGHPPRTDAGKLVGPASLRSWGRVQTADVGNLAGQTEEKALAAAIVILLPPSFGRQSQRVPRHDAISDRKICLTSALSETPRLRGFDAATCEPNCVHQVRNELFAGLG